MNHSFSKLDNPAWYALTETHAAFSEGNGYFKRYNPGVVLFSGFDPENKAVEEIDFVVNVGESFFLFDDFPPLPKNYQVEAIVNCVQMVCEKEIAVTINTTIVDLDEAYKNEMYQLIIEVFPGYYLPDTYKMGEYK